MATETPNRHTLTVTMFIGSHNDMTHGMTALAKQFPEHIKDAEDGWNVVNISHQFVEDLKNTFIEDKIKLTEMFELNVLFYLGWVVARRFTTLHLSIAEPIHHIKATPWEWERPTSKAKAAKNEGSNDS